jgi:hypothetical protein
LRRIAARPRATAIKKLNAKSVTASSETDYEVVDDRDHARRKKAAALCVLTEELLRFSMMAITDFQTELQNALAVETDETFVENSAAAV